MKTIWINRISQCVIKRALVTSIISEGIDFWNGAGDRGDSEMYAYGVSRFLLEMSDEKLIYRFLG